MRKRPIWDPGDIPASNGHTPPKRVPVGTVAAVTLLLFGVVWFVADARKINLDF